MEIAASANNTADGLASQVLGKIEIIGNIQVRKLKKRKVVCTPPPGKPFGLNVQRLPELGIGVNTVHVTSPLFNYIRRGDIVSEFDGKKLHDVTTGEFVGMIRKPVNDGTERKLVIEYTAAYLTRLWEKVETADPKGEDREVKETLKSVTDDPLSRDNSNKPNEEVQNGDNISLKETCHTITKKILSSQVNDSIPINQKPSNEQKNSNEIPPTFTSSKKNNESNEIQPKEKKDVESSVPDVVITTNTVVAENLDTNNTPESDVILDDARLAINGEDFEGWLTQKKEMWNFSERVKKVSHSGINSGVNSDKKSQFEPATSFGLPDGWMVRIQTRSRYTFRCPNGKLFYSKKKVCEYLCISPYQLSNGAVTAPSVESKKIIRSGGPEVTRVYQSAKQGEEKVSEDTKEMPKKVPNPSISKPREVPNESVSKDKPTLVPIGNVLPRGKSPPHLEARLNEENQSEDSNSSVDSLFDIITNLNNARKTVAEFGPLPWKGCKIVKAPPAPHSVGIRVQSMPEKLGIGIVHVEKKSPIYNQVKRGDIITHFMGTPLHGLGCNEVVRLLQSEVQNDRLLHVAPDGFNLKLLHKNTQMSSQSCMMNPVIKEPEPNIVKDKTTPMNAAETNIHASTSAEKMGNTLNENKSYPHVDEVIGDTSMNGLRFDKNHVGDNKKTLEALVDDDKESPIFEKDLSTSDKSTSIGLNNGSQHSNEKNTTVPLAPRLSDTSTTLTERNSSLDITYGDQMPPSKKGATDSNCDAQISSDLERKVQNEEKLDTSIVVKCENQDEMEVFQNADKGGSESNNFTHTNFLSKNESMSHASRTVVKLEETDNDSSYQERIANSENRSTEKIANSDNTCAERIENHDNNSSSRVENVGARSAIEVDSSNIQRIERPSESTVRRWTSEEDNLLRRLVSEYGTDDWGRISLELHRKTATQCRFRWINTLYPSPLMSGNQASSNIRTDDGEDADEKKPFEQSANHNTNDHKKVILPPYDGPLGINVQELPSKKGIGVVRVRETSPFYGKLHRGDVIVQFMEVSLRDISILRFIEMVKEKKNETRHFLISAQRSTSGPSIQSRSVFGIPIIDLNGEDSDEGEKISTFRATGMNLAAFVQEDIDNMPVCFAFNPCNIESQRIAERKQKMFNENFEMRKKQKTHR